jgi:hypothetical protein
VDAHDFGGDEDVVRVLLVIALALAQEAEAFGGNLGEAGAFHGDGILVNDRVAVAFHRIAAFPIVAIVPVLATIAVVPLVFPAVFPVFAESLFPVAALEILLAALFWLSWAALVSLAGLPAALLMLLRSRALVRWMVARCRAGTVACGSGRGGFLILPWLAGAPGAVFAMRAGWAICGGTFGRPVGRGALTLGCSGNRGLGRSILFGGRFADAGLWGGRSLAGVRGGCGGGAAPGAFFRRW